MLKFSLETSFFPTLALWGAWRMEDLMAALSIRIRGSRERTDSSKCWLLNWWEFKMADGFENYLDYYKIKRAFTL